VAPFGARLTRQLLTTCASAASDLPAHALTYIPPLAIGGLHRTEPSPDALVGCLRLLGSAGARVIERRASYRTPLHAP
jgi:hypothetical protein